MKKLLPFALLAIAAAVFLFVVWARRSATPLPAPTASDTGGAPPSSETNAAEAPAGPTETPAQKWGRRLDLLRQLVESGNRDLSLKVIKELKKGGLDALPLLVAALRGEKKPEMRQAIVEVLDDILPAMFGDFEDGWYSNREEMILAARDPSKRAIFDAFRKEAVPALIDVLKNDSDILTRRWAASALGQLGGVEAAKALIEFARAEEESGVKTWSLQGLGVIWDPEAFPLIRDVLQDPDASAAVKAALTRSLGAMGTDEAVDLLIASGGNRWFLAETGNPRALEWIKAQTAASPDFPTLVPLLRFFPEDPFVRLSVQRALADPGMPLHQKWALTNDTSLQWDEVKAWVAAAYRSADSVMRENWLWRLGAGAPWAELLEGETDGGRRIQILGHMGDAGREAIREALVGGDEPSRTGMWRVVYGNPARWADDVAAALPTVTDPRTRLEMAAFLGQTGKRELAAQVLLDVFNQAGDGELRAGALASLAQVGPERLREILPSIQAAALSSDPAASRAAFQALGAAGGEEARRTLLQLAESHPAQAVLQFGPAGFGVDEIAGFSGDSRPGVRNAVILTLGQAVNQAAAEQVLWTLLDQEPDQGMRLTIIQSLGGVGSRATVDRLQSYLGGHPELGGPIETAKEAIFRRLIGQ